MTDNREYRARIHIKSRAEITEAITRSLPELSGVDIRRVYFFMYGAGLIKEQSADHESKE